MKHPLYCSKCGKDEDTNFDDEIDHYEDKPDWQDIALIVITSVATTIIVVKYVI